MEVKTGIWALKQTFELPKTAVFRDFDTKDNIFNDQGSKELL